MNWIDCFSHGRYGQGFISQQPRTPYERDYDRLIFSSAFRRLQNKTQVFPLPGPVFVHNRLTHSLEVASVGRSLGKLVGEALLQKISDQLTPAGREFYNTDLGSVVAAACLAHDIGNPSFGHSGEEAISNYFVQQAQNAIEGRCLKDYFGEEEWQDLSHFEGNANSFRILTHHYNNRQKGGYQLTYTTLASIAKYPCASVATDRRQLHRKKYGFFQADRPAFEEVAASVHLVRETEKPLVYRRHPFVYLVEAADDICYRIIDWEDAHRLGIIDTRTAIHGLVQLLETSPRDNHKMARIHQTLAELENDPKEQLAYLRAKCINYLVVSCAEIFVENEAALLDGSFDRSLIEVLLPESQKALDHINEITIRKIYNHDSVVKIELAGYQVMSALLEDFIPAILRSKPSHKDRKVMELLPLQFRVGTSASAYEKVLSVVDFVAGATDLYAMELYKNLRGISLPAH